jgi:hypothetical protein
MNNQQEFSSPENHTGRFSSLGLLGNRKFALIFLIILILFTAGLYAFFSFNNKDKPKKIPEPNQNTSNQKPVYETQINGKTEKLPFNVKPLEEGIKIGTVTVKTDDLNYQFGMQNSNSPENRSDRVKWKQAANQLSDDAIIQNEGEKLKLYPPNDGNLDYNKVNQATDYILQNVISNISFEKLMIFFNNLEPPKIGTPAAKKRAYEILSDLRNQVKAGQITMEEAGESIKSMNELENIDIAYKVNAYSKFENVLPDEKVTDPEMLKVIWELGKDDVSEILINKEDNEEFYYAFFKITGIVKSDYRSLTDYIDKKKSEYPSINI